MSNSAFTPSTTTVTNNVPVNVPVVTAWEAYTPTVSPISGYAVSPYGQWRRVGDNMEVRIAFRKNTSAGTGGTLLFNLPSGYNIDLTKGFSETGAQPILGTANGFNITTTNQYDRSLSIMYILGNTTQVGIINPGTSAFISGSNVLANAEFNLNFSVPISQWAGSGTTTLATRAVEEYVSYDQATAIGFGGTPSGTIVRGINGALLPNITTTSTAVGGTTFFLTTQSPILDTDRIVLEVTQDGVEANWIDVNNTSSLVPMRLSTADYGVSINRVANSSSEIQVIFGNAGLATGGLPSTFGGVAAAWSSQRTAIRWRVRVVKAGAEIGYPVSARNIVGDTSGTVVPTGMLGEVRAVTGSGTLQVNPSTYGDISGMSLQLGPGVWMLTLKAAAYIKHNAAGNQINSVNLILTDSSNAVIANSPVQAQVENQPQTSGTAMQFVWNLTSTTVWTNTTTQSIKMRGLRSNLTGGIELLNDSDARITAIIATRIA